MPVINDGQTNVINFIQFVCLSLNRHRRYLSVATHIHVIDDGQTNEINFIQFVCLSLNRHRRYLSKVATLIYSIRLAVVVISPSILLLKRTRGA